MAIETWDLSLGNRIISKTKNNGFMSCITKGERGYGKSTYNIKNMSYIYYHIEELSETQAWNKALDNIIFTPDQLMEKIDYNIEHDVISPVWCIDDATVHFSGKLFFINLYTTALLEAAFDTIRTVVNGLLINCPKKKRLLGALKNYDDYEVTIYKHPYGGYQRKSVCIKYYSLPDGKQKFRKEFEDEFSCYIPNWVYEKYMVMRKRYLKEINVEMQRLRDKLQEKKASRTPVF